MNRELNINVNCDDLDGALEKAERLAELLREAQQIAMSLSGSPIGQNGGKISDEIAEGLRKVISPL